MGVCLAMKPSIDLVKRGFVAGLNVSWYSLVATTTVITALSTDKRNIDLCFGVVCCGYWVPAQRSHCCALDTLRCTDRPACDSVARSVVGRGGKMSRISGLRALLLATVCFCTTGICYEGTTHESI